MPSFQSKRSEQTGIMHLKAAPKEVFPLLCPKREYDWIEPWQCRMIFSETGAAEDNAVFYTDFRPDRGPEWWVVSRYEPFRTIAFVRFSPDNRITRLDIHLAPDGPTRTIATWTQTVTALSPEGNAYIDRCGDSSYTQEIKTLEHLLNHYLQTGCQLKLSEQAPEQMAKRD